MKNKDNTIKDMVPSMNVSVPTSQQPQNTELVTDESLLGVYQDIYEKIKSDRTEVTDYIDKFANMVFNDGDATTSSKEALINLIKLKADTSDKMSKIADLMTRCKLKERDTFPRYLSAKQENTINIRNNGAKQALLREINKIAKNKKEEGEQ